MQDRPPLPRWLALAALLALVAAGVLTAWALLTGRADFGAAAPPGGVGEAGPPPGAGAP